MRASAGAPTSSLCRPISSHRACGYVTPWPEDAPRSDAGTLTEGEAWIAHALPRRLTAAGAQAGMTAFARGSLWDMGGDGQALAATRDGVRLGPRTDDGAVVVLWLEGN